LGSKLSKTSNNKLTLSDEIIGSDFKKENLKALLGEDDYKKVYSKLIREKRVSTTNARAFPGSPTASLLAEQQTAQGDNATALAGVMASYLNNAALATAKLGGKAIDKVANRFYQANPELDSKVIKTLLNQQDSIDLLPAILKALERRQSVDKVISTASRAGTKLGQRTLTTQQVSYKRRKNG
jgi:hypothetical protein